MILAPLIYNQIYAATVSTFPGAVFYSIAATAVVSLGLLLTATTTIEDDSSNPEKSRPIHLVETLGDLVPDSLAADLSHLDTGQ